MHLLDAHRDCPQIACQCSSFSHFLFPPPVAESNCTFFKFFTTGENTVMFQKTTQKSESEPLSTAVPPYPPTPPSPALPLAASCFSFSISQSLSLSSLCCCLSHHLLAALFQAGHCLISECLRSVLPTLCSSIILLANP